MSRRLNSRYDRRSCFIMENLLFNSSGSLCKVHSENDLSADRGEQLCTQTIDALSLESTVVWSKGKFVKKTFAVKPVHYGVRDFVKEIVGELVDAVVDRGETKRRERIVENYLERHLPGPLVQRNEVAQIGTTLSTAAGALYGSSSRLHAAWRIILVSAAQQLCQSFSRIITRKTSELQEELELLGLEPRSILTDAEGLLVLLLQEREKLKAIKTDCAEITDTSSSQDNESMAASPSLPTSTTLSTLFEPDSDAVSSGLVKSYSESAYRELRDVTNRILDMTVLYLKNAARDVIDATVEDVKNILIENTRL